MEDQRPQFSLRMLFWWVFACAALSGAGRVWGAVVVLWAGGFLVVAVIWGYAYRWAPELTKYATLFLVLSIVSLTLLTSWLVTSRHEARRRASVKHMLRLGRKLTDEEQLHPSKHRRKNSQLGAGAVPWFTD